MDGVKSAVVTIAQGEDRRYVLDSSNTVDASASVMGTFLRGRIINALGQPIDGGLPFESGLAHCVEGKYINPLARPAITERMEFGIKAIDGLLTIGKGQRIGIFAGSGVGKSTLMGMSPEEMKENIFTNIDGAVIL